MKAIGITILLLSVVCYSIILSCGKDGGKPAHDKAYELLETAAELNANGNKQAALNTIDSALAMRPADTTRCWLMSEKAVALLDMGQTEKAIGHGKQTLELAEEIGDVEAILNMRGTLGIAYRREGKLDSAVYEYKKGIELALKVKSTEYEVYLDNCISVLYSENNRFGEALAYATKAERAAAAMNDTIERLSARGNIGGIYLRQKQYRKALGAMLPTWNDVVKADYNVLTLKYLSIILKSYAVLGDDKAFAYYLPYAEKAMQGVDPSSAGVLGILETKAYMLGRNGQYREQLALLDSMAVNGHLMSDDKLLSERARCLSALGDKAEAFSAMYKAYAMLDSVKATDVEKSMSEFTVRYKTLEKEIALEQARREKAEANRLIFGLVAVIAVLVAVVGILFYRRKVAAQKAQLQEKLNYISGLENERERIAKELHDGVCNDILATTMLLAADTEKGERQLHRIWTDVRHLSHALMPPRFEHVTLADAVRSYVAMISDDDKRKVELTIDEDFNWHGIQRQTAYEVYRIVQEAIGNATKYGSEAAAIQVSMTHAEGKVKVSVSNAVSEDIFVEKLSSGIGAETMDKRAQAIGAELHTTAEQGLYIVNITFRA